MYYIHVYTIRCSPNMYVYQSLPWLILSLIKDSSLSLSCVALSLSCSTCLIFLIHSTCSFFKISAIFFSCSLVTLLNSTWTWFLTLVSSLSFHILWAALRAVSTYMYMYMYITSTLIQLTACIGTFVNVHVHVYWDLDRVTKIYVHVVHVFLLKYTIFFHKTQIILYPIAVRLILYEFIFLYKPNSWSIGPCKIWLSSFTWRRKEYGSRD